jgi:beta-glucosidase
MAAASGFSFPEGFRWGVATSSYQIEGSPDADGKGRSIWDTYSHTPGKIADGSTGDVANDHYRRYKDDVALMKSLGVTGYRFSVSWPRIFPDGAGQPNTKGLDFYSRLVDELLAAGIEPFMTLYHWDLPQTLQDKGGWQSREIPEAFAEYAGYMAEQLSDRVTKIITLNELYIFVEMGHRGLEIPVGGGTTRLELAPGLNLPDRELNQVRHHAVLGHGLAVQAVRARGKAGTKVGPAENISFAMPLVPTEENIRAAELATRELNAPYLTVMLEGRYTDAYLEATGKDAPRFSDDDLKVISQPVDFVGLNIYRPSSYVLASDEAPGYREVPINPSHPNMHNAWQVLEPSSLYWAPKFAHSLWDVPEIHITENGCAADDTVAEDGNVYDTDRVMYLRGNLAQLQRATAEGVPVRGYFLWSLMDNFEWSSGYGHRFGAVYVDYETQERTPKMSAHYYKEVIVRNAVLP